MDREKLIAYSFYYGGEYDKVYRAVKADMPIKGRDDPSAVTILDESYPKCFFDLKYPPFVFYYAGDLSLLKKECIGIVGSRKACDYALKATKGLSLHYHDKIIVSGLAKGIDAAAHEKQGPAIGVLGCGIQRIYPYCNKSLIERLKREGLVISEYPEYTPPLAHHFPFRNRLIAALSKTLYIMQSNAASGTMTSVNEALELGKEIRVLPYDIFEEAGYHNNTLIYEGATPIQRQEIAF